MDWEKANGLEINVANTDYRNQITFVVQK